ncbi:hypothetical protein BBJ28_00015161, partial [Nothophytophthora sp. Chile5]
IVVRRRLERQAQRVQRFWTAEFGFRSVGLDLSALETSIRETLSSRHGLQIGVISYRAQGQKLSKRILRLADELCEYFRLVDGLTRLERRDRPSTSSCGNDTVLEAVRLINGSATERHQLGLPSAGNGGGTLQARLLAGVTWGRPHAKVNQSVAFLVSREDTAERRLEGWRELCAAFSRDKTVLIYHLKNHYALIFALRERAGEASSSDDTTVANEDKARFPTQDPTIREMLTARKGQRPSTWIAWDEVLETLCSWRGYAVLEVSIM